MTQAQEKVKSALRWALGQLGTYTFHNVYTRRFYCRACKGEGGYTAHDRVDHKAGCPYRQALRLSKEEGRK